MNRGRPRHEIWIFRRTVWSQAARLCSAAGHVLDHSGAAGGYGGRALCPNRAAARKRGRDDLARQAVRPWNQAVLSQKRALPNLHGRFGETKGGFATLHAASLQRSDEQRRWYLADDLRWAGGSADRKPEAAPDLSNTWSRRNPAGHPPGLPCAAWERVWRVGVLPNKPFSSH